MILKKLNTNTLFLVKCAIYNLKIALNSFDKSLKIPTKTLNFDVFLSLFILFIFIHTKNGIVVVIP